MDSLKSTITENITDMKIDISFDTFIYSLILSFLLSHLVSLVYNRTSGSLSNKEDFSRLFVPFCLSTTLIITVVKSSLALSLGLVGALSIVRFRAAIKEPEELIYLFIVITIGLGSGANQFLITIFGSLFIIVVMYFVSRSKKITKIKSNNFLLTISSKKKISSINLDAILDILKKNTDYIRINSSSYTKQASIINLELRVSDIKNYNSIVDKLHDKFKEAEFSFSSLSDLSL
jgi:hypothetical protein